MQGIHGIGELGYMYTWVHRAMIRVSLADYAYMAFSEESWIVDTILTWGVHPPGSPPLYPGRKKNLPNCPQNDTTFYLKGYF